MAIRGNSHFYGAVNPACLCIYPVQRIAQGTLSGIGGEGKGSSGARSMFAQGVERRRRGEGRDLELGTHIENGAG